MTYKNTIKSGLKSGVILMALLSTACVGMPKPVDVASTNLPAMASLKTPDQVEAAWQQSQILKYTPVWIENSKPAGDPFKAGEAAYHLSLVTDEAEWSKAAIKSFERVKSDDPLISSRATAGLGASNRMAARNFPIKGIFQYTFFGTPGLKRANHVRTAISLLNKAVEENPNDPVIRQYRATAFVGIPKAFGVRDVGLKDFDQLELWIQNPKLNSEFEPILSSANWQQRFYMHYATALESIDDRNAALENWIIVKDIASDPYLTALAIQKAQN